MRKVTTVIFDLDGTLLDTLEDLCDAVNFVMDKYGFQRRSIEEVRNFVGHGIKRLIRLSVPGGEGNPHFEEAYTSFMDYYVQNCRVKTHVYSGMEELLAKLLQRGIKLAIVSNKNYRAVNELKDFYLRKFFTVAIGEKSGIRKKPAPDTVLTALQELGSSKEEAIFVGDSDVDWETAGNVGVPSVLCSWGFRPRQELVDLKPFAIIDKPMELITVLDKLELSEEDEK